MKVFGWKGPEPKDERDLPYRYTLPMISLLPKTADLRKLFPPIKDQLDLGSCTAFAGACIPEYIMAKNKVTVIDGSEQHLYWWTRFIEDTTDEDSGAYIRDVAKALNKYGLCKESLCPYNTRTFTKKPSDAANKDGLTRQVIRYERVDQLATAIDTCIGVSRRPVLFGFMVPESFMYVGPRGTWTPRRGEEVVGGHAQVLVGYTKTRYIMRNSWGVNWGNGGYCTVPKSFILDSDVCSDFWCIYTGEQM